MKISNKWILERIFQVKGNFAKGERPSDVCFDGIEIAPFKNNTLAAACISADFELNWAWRNLTKKKRDAKGRAGRKNVSLILKILDEYKIPVTWATVGHLFLKECKSDALGRRHPDMPRPTVRQSSSGDWYSCDPASDYIVDNLWYGPDLIKEIISRKVSHEIGTHSFSHIDFSEASTLLVEKEIEACISAMIPFGLTPRSLVFPFNVMGYKHLPVLCKKGIIAVRHRDKMVRMSYPERTSEGIYKIYESMNLRHTSHYKYIDKAEMFLEKAMEARSVYHLWFHPSDDEGLFKTEFISIISHLSKLREEGHLWIATMRDFASYCEARRSTIINFARINNGIEIKLDCRMDRNRYEDTFLTLVIPVPNQPTNVQYDMRSGELNIKPINYFYSKSDRRLILNAFTKVNSIRISF